MWKAKILLSQERTVGINKRKKKHKIPDKHQCCYLSILCYTNWKIHIIVITFIKMSFFFMCPGVLPTCMSVYCMYGTCEGQKRASDSPELEL